MVASGCGTGLASRQHSPAPRALPLVGALHALRPVRSPRRKKRYDGSRNVITIAPRAAYHLSANAQYVAYLHTTREAVVTHAGGPLAGPDSSGGGGSGSTGGAGGGTANVQVVVPKAPLLPGQQLALVGGSPLLGEWDPQHGARLVTNSSGTAHQVELALPVDRPIAAKLVLLQDGLPIHWESGSDRMLFLSAPPLTAGPEVPAGYLLVCNFEDTNRTHVMLWPPAPFPRPPGTSVLQVTVRGDCLPPISLASGAVDDLILTLTGSCSELGDWEPSRGVRLHPDPSTPGAWTARVALRLDQPVAAKLVLCSAAALAVAAVSGGGRGGATAMDVAVAWEPGVDRMLGPAAANKMLLCGWDWGITSLGPVELDLPPPSPPPSPAAAQTAAAARAFSPTRGNLPPPPSVPPPTPAAAAAAALQQQQNDLAAVRKMVEKAAQRGRPVAPAVFAPSHFVPPPLQASSTPSTAAPPSPTDSVDAASKIQGAFATMHERRDVASVEKEARSAEAARAFDEAKELRRRTGSPARAGSAVAVEAAAPPMFGGLPLPPPQSPSLNVVEVLDSFEPDDEEVQVLYTSSRVSNAPLNEPAATAKPRTITNANWREMLDAQEEKHEKGEEERPTSPTRTSSPSLSPSRAPSRPSSPGRGAAPQDTAAAMAAAADQAARLAAQEAQHLAAMEAARRAAQETQRQLEQQLAARAAAEEERVSEYEAQMAALRQQVEAAQSEASSTQISLETLQQQLDASKGREADLSGELAAMQGKLAEAARSHHSNSDAVNALEEALQVARQQYESAVMDLQRADAAGSYSLRLLDRLESAYHSAVDQYDQVETELAAAKSAQQQSEAMLRSMEAQVATSVQLAGNVEVYEKQVQVLQEQLQLSAQAHEVELSALQGQLRSVEARSQQTEDLYESMLKEMKSALDDALVREQTLHTELSSMQARAEEFQRQVERAAAGVNESARQEEALRREVARLRRVIEQYKEYLTEHDGELTRSLEREEALDSQLNSLQAVVRQQEEQLKAALERQEALSQELEQQQKSAEEYKSQLAEQQRELREAAEKQAAMQERAEVMHKEMDRLQNLAETYKSKLESSRSEVEAAAAREAELQKRVEAAGSRENDLLGRVERLQASISQYKSRLQEQERNISAAADREDGLQAALREQENGNAVLREQLESLGGEYRAAVETIEDQRDKLSAAAAVQEEVAVMAVQVQTLQVELSAERTRHTEEMQQVQQALEAATEDDRHRMQAEFEMQKAVLKAEYEVKLMALKEALSVVKTALNPARPPATAAALPPPPPPVVQPAPQPLSFQPPPAFEATLEPPTHSPYHTGKPQQQHPEAAASATAATANSELHRSKASPLRPVDDDLGRLQEGEKQMYITKSQHGPNGNGNGNGVDRNNGEIASSSTTSTPSQRSFVAKASKWASMAAELAAARGEPSTVPAADSIAPTPDSNGTATNPSGLSNGNGQRSQADGSSSGSTATTVQGAEEGGSSSRVRRDGEQRNSNAAVRRRTSIPSNWRDAL